MKQQSQAKGRQSPVIVTDLHISAFNSVATNWDLLLVNRSTYCEHYSGIQNSHRCSTKTGRGYYMTLKKNSKSHIGIATKATPQSDCATRKGALKSKNHV